MRFIRPTSLFIILAITLCWSCETEQEENDTIIVCNVFTPNEKGDYYFEAKSSTNDEVSLNIYTRSGVLVFSIKAELCRWNGRSLDGQHMANGVYFYTAEIPGTNIKKSGHLHLYR